MAAAQPIRRGHLTLGLRALNARAAGRAEEAGEEGGATVLGRAARRTRLGSLIGLGLAGPRLLSPPANHRRGLPGGVVSGFRVSTARPDPQVPGSSSAAGTWRQRSHRRDEARESLPAGPASGADAAAGRGEGRGEGRR